jgi:hypothetical protein
VAVTTAKRLLLTSALTLWRLDRFDFAFNLISTFVFQFYFSALIPPQRKAVRRYLQAVAVLFIFLD